MAASRRSLASFTRPAIACRADGAGASAGLAVQPYSPSRQAGWGLDGSSTSGLAVQPYSPSGQAGWGLDGSSTSGLAIQPCSPSGQAGWGPVEPSRAKTQVPRPKTRDLRCGLAMLELVLALPILLFVMALIVNYGTIAAWKVREHSVARLAVWETRWPRSGSTDPRPSYWWPAAASMESSDQGTVAAMDDSRVDLPVARGPLPPATVNSDLLDPTRGLREGSAGLTRKYRHVGQDGQVHDQGPNVADRRQVAISADGDVGQLAAANSRAVHAAGGPRIAGECLRAGRAGDLASAVPSATAAAGQRPRFHLLRLALRLGRRSRFSAASATDVYDRSAVDRPGRQEPHRSNSRQQRP